MVINQARQQPAIAMAAKTAGNETPELWHRRCGHLGCDNLVKLKEQNMVEGISVSAADFKQEKLDKPFCETCTDCHFLAWTAKAQASWSWYTLMCMDPFKKN